MKLAWLAGAMCSWACAAAPPPPIEHHAAAPAHETFVLDAPLFKTRRPVVWTLSRDGDTAQLFVGDRAYTGSVRGHHAFHAELGEVTLDCHPTLVRAHVAGAEPVPRPCSAPPVWDPPELVTTPAITCTVLRDQLRTEVTMAAPPGLQAVDDDCDRRWEIRRR